MNNLLIKELLMSTGYWVLNKKVVKELGIDSAFLLTNFVEAENMMSDSDGWFFQTIDTVEDLTGLTRHEQNKAIEPLILNGILLQQNRGMPRKRYFKINYEALHNIIVCKNSTPQYVKNLHTSMQKNDKLVCKNFTPNKESIYKQSNNKENIINNKEYSPAKAERHEVVEIVEYLNLVCGTHYKTTTNKTKTLINSRLKEGFTINDFKIVISKKHEQWKNTEYKKFLRPETLFGTKFEGYLNEETTTNKRMIDNIPLERVF